MDLSTTQQILLVILGAALAIFIILAIVVAVLVIRLLQTLRLITTKAEKVIESAEAVGEVFKNASGPVGVFRFVKSVVEMAQQKRK